MLSKKMAVSLMSLITILAFAFIAVTPALAVNRITLSFKDADNATADDQGEVSTKAGFQVFVNNVAVIKGTAEKPLNPDSLTAADFNILQGTSEVTAGSITFSDSKTFTFTVPSTSTAGTKSIIHLLAGRVETLATGALENPGTSFTIEHVAEDTVVPLVFARTTAPIIQGVDRSNGATHPIFESSVTFTITLSEEPAEFTTKFLEVKQADIDSLHAVGTKDEATADEATGADNKFYLYALTLTPKYENGDDIVIKVKKFKDPYGNEAAEDKEYKFQVASTAVKGKVETPGTEVGIPNDIIIPGSGGSLIVAKDDKDGDDTHEMRSDSTYIVWPGDPTKSPGTDRKPNQQKYNMIKAELPDLEHFLLSGGTIDLKSADDVVITEIMWATDSGSSNRQWIEITNTTAADIKTKDYKLVFYTANEDVPLTKEAVAATATTPAIPVGSVPADVADRVGTLYKNAYWSIAGKGQSGSTVTDVAAGDTDVEIAATRKLISMQRGMPDADGNYPDGTMEGSWMASTPPSLNFTEDAKGALVGTPGQDPVRSDAALQAEAEAAANAEQEAMDAEYEEFIKTVMYPRLDQGRIYISEVMFDGGGTLPQWIEISNGDRSHWFHIGGWTLTVENATGTADVDTVTLTIPPGTVIDRSSQHTERPSTVLIVTEQGRNNFPTGWKADEHVIVLDEDGSSTQVDLINADILTGKYSLLSDEAFRITLAPPVPKATKPPATETAAEKAKRQADEKKEAAVRKAAIDTVGNLVKGAAAWELPMNEDGGRSSIIRRHTKVARGPAAPKDGTMAENWVLASDTAFADIAHIRIKSYYGAPDDVGTPGFRPGSALPVELSHFRPARDKATGQVVITWATQSELNNAGFFIKRSQQRNGEFKVINATMIAGAGTTSEKQFYTYTDTTAQPNVVYYYQIEDVSLDGNRQTLTHGIRLKGHIGAAGKLTSTWGELKTSNE